MNEEFKPPKFLVNWNEKGLDRHAIVKGVADFLGLGSAEEALLDYYAGHDTGWQASAKVIAEALQQNYSAYNNRGLIEHTRKQLADKGLIALNDRVILIDWQRLAAVAFANEIGHEYNDTHIVSRGKRQHRVKNLNKFSPAFDDAIEPDTLCWKALQKDDPPIELTEEEIAKAKEALNELDDLAKKAECWDAYTDWTRSHD